MSAHARQRVQFGRAIGSFQAVKHQLADVAIGLEFARPLLDAAALELADRGPCAARDVSAAKIACAGAAHRAARTALQVHGAIGYTQEHDLGLWLTKVRALIPAWGTQAEHRARVWPPWPGRADRLELTGEQRALRDAVRAMLARHQRHTTAAGDGPRYDPSLWRRLCGEIGVAGLAVPEEYGGAGAGPAETHVVAEELGSGLTPSPLLGSAVLATQALLASGDRAACQRLLPPVAAGTAVAALAWTPRPGTGTRARWPARPSRPPARAVAGPWPATAHHVLYGDCADVLLVAARTPDGIGLFDVDPHQAGVTRSAVTTMDLTSRLAVVRLDGAAGGAPAAGTAAQRSPGPGTSRASRSAPSRWGAARRALELTVAYTKVRVQFGRPIGSFQAIAHRLADLHVLVESARSVSTPPRRRPETSDPGLLAAAAKVYCSEAFARVAAEMIQLHGASASPGNTTPTISSSARTPPRSSSASPPGTWPGSPPP